MNETAYDVRVWAIRTVKVAKGVRYQVRWRVRHQVHYKTCATRKMADSFRSGLNAAVHAGEAFDPQSGLPHRMRPKPVGPTWLAHAQAVTDLKWRTSSPRHRQSTAEALTTITMALLEQDLGADWPELRQALRLWAFNPGARAASPTAPQEYLEPLAWVARHSRPLHDLADLSTVRHVLAAVATNLDGSPASASTANRKRAALSAALVYAVELGHLEANPLPRVKARRSVTVDEVDARSVVNPDQARTLLAAVKGRAPALHAYFACLYFAGLRPAEAANLRLRDLTLPPAGWGDILLCGSYQATRPDWTDDRKLGEERGLKHRARAATRRVPAAPELVQALREHVERFGVGADGRLFVTRAGKTGRPVAEPFVRPVSSASVGRVLRLARADVFTPAQQASPLARRAYDLRHACVSTWLAAGVAPSQVAAWAGHSVAVLLRVYAHAVDGQEETARRRIAEALGFQPLLNHGSTTESRMKPFAAGRGRTPVNNR